MKTNKAMILIGMLLFVSTISANAAELEISTGQSKYTKSDNGIWWQNPFPNEFKLQSNSIAIGMTDYLTDNVRWHAGYKHLGNVSSYAEAVGNDYNYNGVNGCVGACMPMSHWYGFGYVHGIYATLAPEYRFTDKAKVFFEAGFWAYQAIFTMTIPDWYSAPGDTVPKYIRVEHSGGLVLGAIFGAGIEYDNMQLVVTWLRSDANGNPDTIAIYQHQTMDVSLRVRF